MRQTLAKFGKFENELKQLAHHTK